MKTQAKTGLGGLEKTDIQLGFIPLTDCAPLVVAKEKGYFEKYGLQVSLSKETSWANIRDKVAIGILDGAQMLAPMPLAMSLGIGPIHKPMITALSLDLNGNSITVSNALYEQMRHADEAAMQQRSSSVQALKSVIVERKARSLSPLKFAVVFPFSPHNYELRYWMATAGIDPEHDIQLVVVPPSQMVTQLEQGHIDGYCVGEPWNALAVQKNLGRTLITKYEIWNNSPEKVFGVTEEWALQHPNTHTAILMALLEACEWLDHPEHRVEVAAIIARSIYVNAPEHIVRMSMTGTYQYSAAQMAESLPDFNVFYRYAANFPWRSHALWFLTQMMRWGQIEAPVDIQHYAETVYRPDIFRGAAQQLAIDAPLKDMKSEGEHHQPWSIESTENTLTMGADAFFDHECFEPQQALSYLKRFAMHNMTTAIKDYVNGYEPPSDLEKQHSPQVSG